MHCMVTFMGSNLVLRSVTNLRELCIEDFHAEKMQGREIAAVNHTDSV